MRVRAPQAPTSAMVAGAAAFNAGLALVLIHRGVSSSALLAFLPLLVLLFGLLVSSDRSVLLAAALGLSMTVSVLQKPVPLPFPGNLYWTDVIVVLAVAAWVARRLALPAEARPRLPTTQLLGPPMIFFASVTLWAALRGHYAYGANLLGEPVRLFGYVLLVFAFVDLKPRTTYRTIVAVFYTGTVWMFVNALYYSASGGSQTDQVDLSTGGRRILALSTAIYLSGGLFLALLNLEMDRSVKRRALHVLMAALALTGVIVAYGRATYLAVALVVPVLLAFLPRVRRGLVSVLPIFVPFILLVAIALPYAAPSIVPAFKNRIVRSNGSDANVRWRVAAAAPLWDQVHESPITGVGFGKSATFRFDGALETITQDPHDSFLYLLAGGGVLTLGAFLLLVLTFLADAVIRLRRATDRYQRLIVLWSIATLWAFLINATAGPILSDPRMLLTVWAVMLLPSSIAPAEARVTATRRRAQPARTAVPAA
jgi:O-antigen ligase